ncbi:shematrin-like protein 1 [Prunus yedoensis var. nudiflora]|uniref:Shematrin-like protein 1 n=1 Tax=Prunus yedoensis var. nudiflora TaxID=2094558 RepID=A0A314YI94_PRUYE|nr:shematrin-like protein 1 [Prunus yedoensis var. nudiflora]
MSDRKEWQHSYQPMNYNGYDSYGSNSQSIGQHYGQYNFTHQGGPKNQYGSSSQFSGQYGGHNYVGGFGGQYGGHNYIGGYDLMNQNGSNDKMALVVKPIKVAMAANTILHISIALVANSMANMETTVMAKII